MLRVPRGDVAADITCSEDKLILIPGNAAATALPVGMAGVLLEHKKD